MKRLLFFLFLMVIICGTAIAQPKAAAMEDVAIPTGFKKLAEAKGDLDKDGAPELVVVFDTPKELELGTERQLWIYKQNGSAWKLWHKCTGPVLPSKHGGVMGDPFDGIEIERGCIVIDHFGGSAPKWIYTHRYRYQNNNWVLIGAHIRFGRSPDEWSDFDYNLSTGKIIAYADKSNESDSTAKSENVIFYRKIKKPVLMDGINTGQNEVKLPGKHDPFYF